MTIEISVYPNPFEHYIMMEITCESDIDCIILLADVTQGKIIRMLGAGLKSGTNRIPLENLEMLEAGNYNLEIKTAAGDAVYRTRLFKQSTESPLIHLN
ncbi:MAG TPA: hypothetical protein VGS79_11770 [Puia sp.]|nr:hypothetical protein [Puia sp.]